MSYPDCIWQGKMLKESFNILKKCAYLLLFWALFEKIDIGLMSVHKLQCWS